MLFGVSAALRWIGWHVIVFNFVVSSFLPRRVEGTVFFFVVIFGRQHGLHCCVVCGGLFFCWVSGFSRPVSEFCSEIFLWRV